MRLTLFVFVCILSHQTFCAVTGYDYRAGNRRIGNRRRPSRPNRPNRPNRTGQINISTSFDLTMSRASLRDFVSFLSDITRGILEPHVDPLDGKSYGFTWASDRGDQSISLSLNVIDQFASIIRSFGGPRGKLPLNSQVLKNSRHIQRPVLQTIIDFIEEQTNHHYSREIGQLLVTHMAHFTGLYFSSSAQIISSILLWIVSFLENKEHIVY